MEETLVYDGTGTTPQEIGELLIVEITPGGWVYGMSSVKDKPGKSMTTHVYHRKHADGREFIKRLEQDCWCVEKGGVNTVYRRPTEDSVEHTVLLGHGVQNTIGATPADIYTLYRDLLGAIRQAWQDSIEGDQPVSHDQYLHFKTAVDFWQGRYLQAHDRAWRDTHDLRFIP